MANKMTVEFLQERIDHWQTHYDAARRAVDYAENQLTQHQNLLAAELGATVVRNFTVIQGDGGDV